MTKPTFHIKMNNEVNTLRVRACVHVSLGGGCLLKKEEFLKQPPGKTT